MDEVESESLDSYFTSLLLFGLKTSRDTEYFLGVMSWPQKMTPKGDSEAPVSSHKGLSPLNGPNINDELGKATADKGPESESMEVMREW